MIFGKLLASGRMKPGGRYRLDKRVHLPKFGSGKNPFASGERIEPQSQPEPAREVTLIAPEPVRLEDLKSARDQGLPLKNILAAGKPAIAKLAKLVAKVPSALGPQVMRGVRGLGRGVARLNPMPLVSRLLARRRAPVRAAVDTFRPPVVQTELSLDAVKVVRNDLSDADLEVVLVAKPAAASQSEQLIMASAGGREPVGAINRLSSWMFGAKTS